MRVALLWNHPDRLAGVSIRYEHYVRGFERLGHEVVLVSTESAAEGFGLPVRTAPSAEAFRDPDFWQEVGPDAAVAVTWLGMPDVLAALRRACPHVVSVADSDCLIGARAHPGALLYRMVHLQPTWGLKLRTFKFWLRLYLHGYRAADGEVLRGCEAAHRVVVHSDRARENFRRFASSHGRPALADKVAAVAYPVDDCFLSGDPAAFPKRPLVTAVGRWDSSQKDAALLVRGIDRFLRRGGRAEFAVIGRGGDRWLGPLARRHPQVRVLGPLPPEEVAAYLRASQVLLLTSRWEGAPIVANEALASGCTLVGPEHVPFVGEVCTDRGCGTAFGTRSAAAVARALVAETNAWAAGRRDPVAIAGCWRPWCDPAEVARRLLAGHPGVAADAGLATAGAR
jgi:glycosyltransferase involved in cell wall biosynthesis